MVHLDRASESGLVGAGGSERFFTAIFLYFKHRPGAKCQLPKTILGYISDSWMALTKNTVAMDK